MDEDKERIVDTNDDLNEKGNKHRFKKIKVKKEQNYDEAENNIDVPVPGVKVETPEGFEKSDADETTAFNQYDGMKSEHMTIKQEVCLSTRSPILSQQKSCEPSSNDFSFISYSIEMGEEEFEKMSEAVENNKADLNNKLFCIQGDASAPCLPSPWIIVHCVDSSGHWPEKGFFASLRSRFGSWIQTYYELAGQSQNLQLGDLHLLPVPKQIVPNIVKSESAGIENQTDNKYGMVCEQWIALLVGQPPHDEEERWLSGIYDVDYDAIKKGLLKLRKVINEMFGENNYILSNPSLHLARIGSKTEWKVIQRMFQRYICSISGVGVWVYYYTKIQNRLQTTESDHDDDGTDSSDCTVSKDGTDSEDGTVSKDGTDGEDGTVSKDGTDGEDGTDSKMGEMVKYNAK